MERSGREGDRKPNYEDLEREVRELKRKNREQAREIAELRRIIEQLEERLGLHSQNSSMPSSKDPLHAPQRPPRPSTGRRRGGQPGHTGKRRELLPVEEADEVVSLVPSHCEHCRAQLPEKSHAGDPPPERHQVYELPEKLYELVEYQAHARTCEQCGLSTRAEIPEEHRSAFGPRLAAALAQLTGGTKTSRRDAQAFVEDVFGIPMSLGSVSNLEAEVSESLAEPHTEVAEAVRSASEMNVDETGWKVSGRRAWLWTAATPLLAFFVISADRGKRGFRKLLERVQGFITSDRWHVYAEVKSRWRQICWSHLKRDFKRLAEKKGEAGRIGEELVTLTRYVFTLWHEFKRGDIDRRTLNHCLRSIKAELRELLVRGVELDMEKVSIFCQNLLDLWPALWNFAIHDGLEPTNNHAERVLRYAVIWRKISFGAASERGCRYVERMLSTVQSCRLQKRSTYHFIVDALKAHRTGAQAPSLLPAHA